MSGRDWTGTASTGYRVKGTGSTHLHLYGKYNLLNKVRTLFQCIMIFDRDVELFNYISSQFEIEVMPFEAVKSKDNDNRCNKVITMFPKTP